MKQLTIVGAGWAGLSAAVAATQAGWHVHLYETARKPGGRARSLTQTFAGQPLDNGQHVLIGAYRDTQSLMRIVGLNPDELLLRAPLDLRFANGEGLCLSDWPRPFNLLWGMVSARGWNAKDKISLIQAARHWQRASFACDPDWTVACLCDHHQLSNRVMTQLIEPLCLSALNTPVDQASAAVFLRVLHDALMGDAGSSDLLMPRVDLGSLFPDACTQWLDQHGATLHLGTRVSTSDLAALHPYTSQERAVLLACPHWEAARLTTMLAPEWANACQKLNHAAITTVYLHCQAKDYKGLARPMMALHCTPDEPAQFVFDKAALNQQPGLLAAVVSACTSHREEVAQQVQNQVRKQLGLSDLAVIQTVVEKRATFVCSPQLIRPTTWVTQGIWACGDYLEGPYPSTIEGAVRSGQQVVTQLSQMAHS